MLPDFGMGIAFWKVPRLRPSILLGRVMCKLRWLRSFGFGAMIVTGQTEITPEKSVPVTLCPP